MNSNKILSFLYDLNNLKIKIWLDDKKIRLLLPLELNLNKSQKEFIEKYRDEIVTILDRNNLSSSNYNSFILKNESIRKTLSLAQEGIFFIHQYEEGTNAYNVPIIIKLKDIINFSLLQESIKEIRDRHEVLKTIIKKDHSGKGYQDLIDERKLPFEIGEFYCKNNDVFRNILKSEINKIFQLDKEYPIRVNLYKVHNLEEEKNDTYLSIVFHHIVFDGWSEEIFFRELEEYYNYHFFKQNGGSFKLKLPVLNIQYSDYALWQRKYLNKDRLNNQLEYWKKKLSSYEKLNLITDKTRPKQINYSGKDIWFEIDEDISLNLKHLAKLLNVSLYSLLLSAYYILMRVYSNQDDIVLGTPVANRNYKEIENLIGFFVNSLVLRTYIKNSELIMDFIKRVSDEVIEAQYNQDLPFEKLVEAIDFNRDPSRHPIFQVMFGMDSYNRNLQTENQIDSLKKRIKLEEILEKTNLVSELYNVAKFDISTIINDSSKKLTGIFNYAESLYKENTIQNFISTYKNILKQFADLYKHKTKLETFIIQDLTYLSEDEYQKVVFEWNKTEKIYHTTKMIHQLFEEQVEKTPNNIAVIYGDNELTYLELNRRANILAHYLQSTYQLKPDDLATLCLDRNDNIIIGILAILKAGAAYVPIDPEYPDDRIKYILNDTKSKVVITNDIYKSRIENISDISIIVIDEKFERTSISSSSNVISDVNKNNLAYVIYTSGTTGTPKGVMIEHKSVTNLILSVYASVTEIKNKSVILNTSIGFDPSVWNIFLPIISGSYIIIPKENIPDTDFYISTINKYSIELFHSSPTLLNSLMQNSNFRTCISIIRIIGGGSKWTTKSVKTLHFLLPNVTLHNVYGPTEVTIHTSECIITVLNSSLNFISIGKPIQNMKMYILDTNLNPVPVGAVGEICVAGIGLARGYLNQPDLTAEKFIPNPFSNLNDNEPYNNQIIDRLYKTGDLARFHNDGNIEFIGRNDFQVKIRGFRIELTEIETVLLNYPGVKKAAVVIKQKNIENDEVYDVQYLVGYYVSDKKLDSEDILAYLQSALPEYMIPQTLIHLEELPLTLNDKIDLDRLPNPELVTNDNYVAPRNELEKSILKIWADVLKLPENMISINDNFFKLGGDSIVSIQLVSKLRQELNIIVNVKDVFNNRNIKKLFDDVIFKKINDNRKITFKTEQGKLEGELGLLPIQEWFFASNYYNPVHWNQSFMIRVSTLAIEKLKVAVNKLQEHHDIFRVRYHNGRQFYKLNTREIQLQVISAEDANLNKLTELQSKFNLKNGPLGCIAYIHDYPDGSARIFIAMHHLIVDAVSWRILVEDLKSLYHDQDLSAKGSSYRQWVEAVKQYAITHKDEREYWQNILSDYNKSQLESFLEENSYKEHHSFELDNTTTEKLLRLSNKSYNTQINDLLLTALAYGLEEITESDINHVLLESHGREEIDTTIDISRTVGWFTTLHPVRLQIKSDIKESIITTKEYLRNVPNKGVGYGALIGYTIDSMPKISFNYLGQFNSSFTEEEFWKIVDEERGVSVDPFNDDGNIININGLIIDGKLKFSIDSKLNKDLTKAFSNSFKKYLNGIIDHTTNLTRSYLTVSDIDSIVTQEYLNKLQQEKEIKGIYLANSLQQGFIYHALKQGDIDDAYRVQLVWEYHNKLIISKYKEAWELAQAKYPALRLRFAWEEEVVQIIEQNCSIDWRYIDLSEQKEDECETRIKYILKQDRLENYNLSQGKLFRIYLIKQNDNLYTCILSNHHSILDGWSGPILLKYVENTYLKLLEGKEIEYSEDVVYEKTQKYLQEHEEDHIKFWEEYLSQIDEGLDLNLLSSYNRVSEVDKVINLKDYRHILEQKIANLNINSLLYENLKNVSQLKGVTLNAILQYVWHKVLSLYCNSKQTIVGATVSGRDLPIDGIENSVGLYINTLPLVVNHEAKNKTVIEAILDIQTNISEISSRSNVSLRKLQKRGENLFDSIFVYENYPDPRNNEKSSLLNSLFKEAIEKLDYPLSIVAYESNDQLNCSLRYAGEIFSNEIINELLITIKILLEQIATDPERKLSDLNYLTEETYTKVVYKWNATDTDYPRDKTIHQLFEEQVEKTPNNVAVIYEDIKLTYKELNEEANRLAHYLIRNYRILPDDLIALYLDRSEHIIIAILAVLKSGGAYVPIDPNYPDERSAYILKDTGSKIVLTNEIYKERLSWILSRREGNKKNGESKAGVLTIDSYKTKEILEDYSKENPSSDTKSNNLVYVIYTSGTTGIPKGVMIEHKSLVNLALVQKEAFNLNELNSIKNCLYFASYAFDAHAWEIYAPIITGNIIYIINDLIRYDVILLSSYIKNNRINIATLPPTLLNSVDILDLDLLIVAGDKSNKQILDSYKKNGTTVINAYGPTEATVCTSFTKYNKLYTNIGNPISNVKHYVLDYNAVPIPIGAVGELYIGGESLSRGYLNQEFLNETKFISIPFMSKSKGIDNFINRLYKTGDLVRFLPNGQLEYIGRNDSQIKLSGYRIELHEIERILCLYKSIKQAVVTVKSAPNDVSDIEKSNKYLIAYYVSEKKLYHQKILEYLQNKLPEFMIPKSLVQIKEIPLTTNGKLNIDSLPAPKNEEKIKNKFPDNILEEKLIEKLRELLKLNEKEVWINDNIFTLGVDSLTAIKFVSYINKTYKSNLSIKEIILNPTIASISKIITNKNKEL